MSKPYPRKNKTPRSGAFCYRSASSCPAYSSLSILMVVSVAKKRDSTYRCVGAQVRNSCASLSVGSTHNSASLDRDHVVIPAYWTSLIPPLLLELFFGANYRESASLLPRSFVVRYSEMLTNVSKTFILKNPPCFVSADPWIINITLEKVKNQTSFLDAFTRICNITSSNTERT